MNPSEGAPVTAAVVVMQQKGHRMGVEVAVVVVAGTGLAVMQPAAQRQSVGRRCGKRQPADF